VDLAGKELSMITGSHIIIYSTDAEADRDFLREVLGWPHVDAGRGWLIFALPPAELAVHPAEENDRHELYLLCDDVRAVVARLQKGDIHCEPLTEAPWGTVTRLTLPGGGRLGVYQPKHPLATGLAAK
jgi:predicted enzyme related to lactoylglutathione lyase